MLQTSLGPHYDSLTTLLPLLQHNTSVLVGDGCRTSFWHDRWCGDCILADKFASLYTHSLSKIDSVAKVLSLDLRGHFAPPRLSSVASDQFTCLCALLAEHPVTNGQMDVRRSIHNNDILKTSHAYLAQSCGLPPCPNWMFIWNNKAPLKVQFFAWLLAKDRLPTKRNLHKKNIVSSPDCDLCNTPEETASHLCLHCPFAAAFWNNLHIQINITSMSELASLLPPHQIPGKHFRVFYLLCFWCLWNHRHGVVFRHEEASLLRIFTMCVTEATMWAERLKFDYRHVVSAWKSLFSSSIRSLDV